MNLVGIHCYVSGKVQGVGFRYSTLRTAQLYGVVGWVRNTEDGRVEIEAQGKSDDIDALLEWCQRGPTSARVDEVLMVWRDVIPKIAFKKFEIR